MILANRWPKEEVDARAVEICQDMETGEISQAEGRRQLLELAMLSMVIDEVSRSAVYRQPRNGPRLELQDLRDRYLDVLTDKILGKEGVTPFDPARILSGDSYSGWMKNLLTGSTRFHQLRRHREFNARGKYELLMPTHSQSTGAGYIPGIDALPGAAGNIHGEVFEDIHRDVDSDRATMSVLAGYLADRTALRGDPLRIRQARTAVRGLSLRAPVPVGWQRSQARARIESLLERIGDDELLAILDGVAAGQMPAPGAARQLAMMWSLHTPEQVERVCQFGAPMVRLLTQAAITPVPAPRQASVKMLNRRVAAELGLMSRVTSGLVSAWADSVCEMTGSEWSATEIRQRTSAEMEAAFEHFAALAGEFLERNEDRLGTSVSQIHDRLAQMFDDVEVDRLAQREQQVVAQEQTRASQPTAS